jgi:hypothetical protein
MSFVLEIGIGNGIFYEGNDDFVCDVMKEGTHVGNYYFWNSVMVATK